MITNLDVVFAAPTLQNQAMDFGDALLFSSLVWSDATPKLRIRRNGDESTLVPIEGIRLRYSIDPSQTRRCVGHKPFRDPSTPWVDCDAAPLAQSRTCDRCSAIDATFASQLHHAHTLGTGEIDAAVRTHLDKPNVAYLAGFRDGSVKIGTSTAPRLETRLREQGAWAARIVAHTTNGFAVRVLEDTATAELGLAQSVSMRRKLNGLTQPKPEDSLDRELSSWVFGVHRIINELDDDRLSPVDEPWENPLRGSPAWQGLHHYPHRLDGGAHDLKFMGACGRAVQAVRPGGDDRFVLDVGQLFGHEIALADDVVADEITVQDSLF